MARGSQEREQRFIQTAKDKTGHSVDEWMVIITKANLESKTNTILKHLKAEHGLNHMQANHLAGIFLNDGKPVFDYDVMFARLFDGKAALRPIYDQLQAQIDDQFDDVVFVPTKAYISIEGQKIFGCAKLTSNVIRLGLDLGNMPFEGRVQKAKGLGAMPNITHMVELTHPDDIDEEVLQLTSQAFALVHGD